MNSKYQSFFASTISHSDENCPLLARRIACEKCGSPQAEEKSMKEYEEELQWPVYEEAKGG